MAELYALQGIVSPLHDHGATLVALSPQLPAHGLSIVEKHGLSFDILSDPHNDYAQALGLRFTLPTELQAIYASFGIDLPLFDGDNSWTLPMPGRIVVDQSGIVRAVDVDPDYTLRPEPETTLAVVRKICGSAVHGPRRGWKMQGIPFPCRCEFIRTCNSRARRSMGTKACAHEFAPTREAARQRARLRPCCAPPIHS